MFEAHLKNFLQQRAGLAPSDMPFVLSSFMIIKGLTFVSFVTVGVKLRPLSRLFAATGRAGIKKLGKELEKNAESKTKYASNLRRLERFRGSYERKKGLFVVGGTATFWERMGSKYRHYSGLLTARLQKNETFVAVSKWLGMDPGPLGLGMAEGILCYKAMFWAHGPIALYLAVKITQFKGGGEGAKGGEKKEEDGVVKEMHDIAELSSVVTEMEKEEAAENAKPAGAAKTS